MLFFFLCAHGVQLNSSLSVRTGDVYREFNQIDLTLTPLTLDVAIKDHTKGV